MMPTAKNAKNAKDAKWLMIWVSFPLAYGYLRIRRALALGITGDE
jgi:hypothetical protein